MLSLLWDNTFGYFFNTTANALTEPETREYDSEITIKEEFVPSDGQHISLSMVKEIAPFVGTIDNGFHSGMGCLLNDGSLLTALHVIYDFELGEYRPLELMTVSFLKDNKFYHYKISGIIHDGTSALRAVPRGGPSTYDYARLRLTENPTNDLEGGLIVDSTNYSLTISNPKPAQLLSISAPVLTYNTDGAITATRYISISENKSARGGFYTFPVIGNYFRQQGFSGQALFPYVNGRMASGALYAVHKGYNGNEAIGFECFEYALQVNNSRNFPFGPGIKPQILFGFVPEVLTQKNIEDIEVFLGLLKCCADSREEIDNKKIPKSLLTGSKCDTHQSQHMTIGSKRNSKTIICAHIAKTDNNPVMIALLNTMDLLVRHYYRKNRNKISQKFSEKTRQNIPDKNEVHARHNFFKNVVSAVNIIIDMQCCISDEDTETKYMATAFYIDGFTSKEFHIVPLDPNNPKKLKLLNYIINADDILREAKAQIDQGISNSSKQFSLSVRPGGR